MELLSEFFNPVPIVALGLAIFGLVAFWAFSRFFRMPENFNKSQATRDDIRFKLVEKDLIEEMEAAEAAAAAASRAEKASRAHWMAVYLSLKKDAIDSEAAIWEAIILDRKGNRGTAIIPALGLETQVSLRGTEQPNEEIRLKLISVKIPEGEIGFALA